MLAHFRPIFITFLGLSLGLWLAELFRCGKIAGAVIVVSVLTITLLISLLHFAFKGNKFFTYLWRTSKVPLTLLISFIFGCGLFTLAYFQNNKEPTLDLYSYTEASLIADIRNTPVTYDDRVVMLLDNASIMIGSSSISVPEGIYLRVDSADLPPDDDIFKARSGDTLLVKVQIKSTGVFWSDQIFSFAHTNNISYLATADVGNMTVIFRDNVHGIDLVQEYIKEIIYDNMETRHAGLAYAIFLGDKSGLEPDLYGNFQASGIAHLLAVSGINVALMVIVLVWIFKRCRMKSILQVILVTALLVVYCLLCDMAPSVVRAALMAIFLLIGKAFGKQNDNLNNVSLAGILILLVNPLMLFDIGFQLSFIAVFGIFFLFPILKEMFMKWRLGHFVSDTLAVSLAAQIATMPIVINTFSYVSTVGLLANLVIVPFIGWWYMAFFVCLMLCILMPFLGFALWLCQWGLWLVDIVSTWFASLPFSTVTVTSVSAIVISLFLIALWCSSRFCVLPKKIKILSNLTIWVCLALLVVINYTILPSLAFTNVG